MSIVAQRPEDDRRERVHPDLYEWRLALHSNHPAALIGRRPDLYGVYGLADVACDSVLWSA